MKGISRIGGLKPQPRACGNLNGFVNSITAMARVNLFPDFKEFLKSLNSARVRYLLLGGYAAIWDGIRVPLISLDDLRANKLASGRTKDLADLENLPAIVTDHQASPTERPKARRRKRGS